MAKSIPLFDVVVIGGGINGAGIARDAAGRGLKVLLLEKHDLASATSSASTKLIHGGLRYLEHKEFALVRASLKEREVLLKMAPHIIWPMRFVLPHVKAMRPYWLIRLGLLIYDYLGGRLSLPRSKSFHLRRHVFGKPLEDHFKKAISYFDCWVEDARLVVLNALDCKERGGVVLTRTTCTELKVVEKHWQVSFKTEGERTAHSVKAKMVINASGPWVDEVLNLAKPSAKDFNVKLVKGSHIIIPKLFEGSAAYILQNDDKRVIFAIPYERQFTLIGTTDQAYEGLPDGVRAEMNEVEYLCRAVNQYFKTKIKPDDVLWTYSGVRPLLDDGQDNLSTITRDYVLNEMVIEGVPLLNVYGGKLTTYRKLSEQAVDFITARLRPEMFERYWTHYTPLPGGDIQALDFESFFKNMKRVYSWMPEKILYRYARAYGSRLRVLLKGCRKIEDLGEYLGDDLYSLEIEYLLQIEMAMTAEDIIWRRSKLGLHISDETLANLERYLDDYYQRA